jgi:hypothetical protein
MSALHISYMILPNIFRKQEPEEFIEGDNMSESGFGLAATVSSITVRARPPVFLKCTIMHILEQHRA